MMTRVFLVRRGGLVRPGFARCIDAFLPSFPLHVYVGKPWRITFSIASQKRSSSLNVV